MTIIVLCGGLRTRLRYEQALAEGSIDPARSFAVGDRNSDLDPASA